MKQKALVLAICMACSAPAISLAKSIPSEVSGLNLGEIETKSFLGESFKGEIPILFTSNQKAGELKVSLAPDAVYTQLGAEKTPELSQLRFSISTKSKHPKIVIQSIRKIQEPFLNFILEIKSPIGSIYQDFTVMLDPKGYDKTQSQQNKKSVNNLITKKHTFKKQASQYKVISGDSLSKISQKFKANHVSLNTMMEAIHKKNPNAFVNNDINKIKQGVILNLPSFKEIVDTSTAIKKVLATEKSLSPTPTGKKEPKLTTEKKGSSSRITYKVKKGDTLSKITRDFRKKGMSFTKLMNTIHAENPHAFSKNKINLLKSGVVLTIPSTTNTISAIPKGITNNKPQHLESITKQIRKVASSQPTKNTAKIDIELIQQLKSASNEVIGNLEKRVRELRSELSTVNNNFSALKAELEYKNSFIHNQNNKVSKRKKSINKLELKHKDYYKEVEKSTSEDAVQRDIANSNIEKVIPETISTDKKKRAVPKNLEQIISTFFASKISEDNQLVNVKNLS